MLHGQSSATCATLDLPNWPAGILCLLALASACSTSAQNVTLCWGAEGGGEMHSRHLIKGLMSLPHTI